MDEEEEFIDYLLKRNLELRGKIRKFYRDYPQHDPRYRGMTMLEILEEKNPKEKTRRLIKETMKHDDASSETPIDSKPKRGLSLIHI